MGSIYAAGFIWRLESLHEFRKKNTWDRNNSLEHASTRAHMYIYGMLHIFFLHRFKWVNAIRSVHSREDRRMLTVWQREGYLTGKSADWLMLSDHLPKFFFPALWFLNDSILLSKSLCCTVTGTHSLFLCVSLIFHLSFLSVHHPVPVKTQPVNGKKESVQ